MISFLAGPFIGGGPAWRQRLGPFSIVPAQHPPCLRRDRIKMDVLLVIATMYADVGPTYCGQMTGSIAEPWVALPLGGDWQCGDLVYMRFDDGQSLMARALDAGPFLHHCVETPDGCLPIAVDVPAEHWQHGTATSARLSYFIDFTADARRHVR